MRAAGARRVIFLNHAANETGPPVVLLAFQRWLRAHTSVDFATIHYAGGSLLAAFEELGDTTVVHRRWGPEVVAGGLLQRAHREDLARAVAVNAAKLRIGRVAGDLVFVNALAPVNVNLLRALDPDVPVIAHVHELSVILEHRLAPDALADALEATDHFVAVSGAVRDNLVARHQIPEGAITVVHEFIDEPPPAERLDVQAAAVRRELGLAPDALLVVSCGSTDWRKAPDLFLRMAWEQRRRRADLDVTYVWVGNTRNGDEELGIRWEVDRLDLGDRVRFVGVRTEPLPWFRAADVFVLPSREDPFPLVCLEAAATATPVVCFDTGGMPEMVGPNDAGVVVRYPDVIELADVVCGLLDDPVARARAGANASAAVRRSYLTEQLAPKLLAVIEAHLPRR